MGSEQYKYNKTKMQIIEWKHWMLCHSIVEFILKLSSNRFLSLNVQRSSSQGMTKLSREELPSVRTACMLQFCLSLWRSSHDMKTGNRSCRNFWFMILSFYCCICSSHYFAWFGISSLNVICGSQVQLEYVGEGISNFESGQSNNYT